MGDAALHFQDILKRRLDPRKEGPVGRLTSPKSLERRRRVTGVLPKSFWDMPMPEDPEASVRSALAEERDSRPQLLRFWDASAVVPALVREPKTDEVLSLLREDEGMAVWWATQIECASALSRRLSAGTFDLWRFDQSVDRLAALLDRWTEEMPSREMRMLAEHFLVSHRPKTADALQLAAAFQWCEWNPVGSEFMCLDNRLRTAAGLEGFSVLPYSV